MEHIGCILNLFNEQWVEQSDSRCWANQNNKDWDGDKSTTAERLQMLSKPLKTTKIETETILHRAERLELFNKSKQERLRRRQVNSEHLSRATRGVEQNVNKARKIEIETETSLQRAKRFEVLNKTKQERLRWRHVYNEQSDSRFWAKQSKKN